jgi:hypothetical protein
MKTGFAALVIGMSLALGAEAALAHHSFAAEFDADKPIDISGTVTKIEWMNPHTFFYVDVEGEDGTYVNWAIELGSPNGLMRRGWTRNSMTIGDTVNVVGSQARDGSYKANARTVTLASGERMFAGTSQPDVEENGQEN